MPTRKVFKDSDTEDSSPGSPLEHVHANEIDEDEVSDEADLADSSDDDAEPDTVTFTDSKKTILDRVRFALRQIESDKQKSKEKRRKRDEIFKEQKKQKLARLEDCRLPDDVLDVIAAKPSTQKSSVTASRHLKDSIEPADEIGIEKDDIDPQTSAPDFIPLNSCGIKAVSDKQLRQIASKSQSALEFRHRQLYGRRIPREPASAILARRSKKAAMRR